MDRLAGLKGAPLDHGGVKSLWSAAMENLMQRFPEKKQLGYILWTVFKHQECREPRYDVTNYIESASAWCEKGLGPVVKDSLGPLGHCLRA